MNDARNAPSILYKLKLKNMNKLVIEHLNINSLPIKFSRLKLIIKNINILVITETKIDSSFLLLSLQLRDSQFCIGSIEMG